MTVLRSGSATDVGKVRSVNQDLVLESPTLFAVADGMGGHVGGEVASKVALDALGASFSHQPSITGLEQAVRDANSVVWGQGQANSELHGMGTTMTAAALVTGSDGRDVIALANVGDSRAYVFSNSTLTQVTVDHSLAEEKVRLGELSEAEAAVHPHRHILTRALGVASEVDVDLWQLHLHSGDRLLMCSDGLTNEVDATRIAEVLAATSDPTEAAGELVAAANENGGNDNITVLIVDILVGDDEASMVPVAAPVSEDNNATRDEPRGADGSLPAGSLRSVPTERPEQTGTANQLPASTQPARMAPDYADTLFLGGKRRSLHGDSKRPLAMATFPEVASRNDGYLSKGQSVDRAATIYEDAADPYVHKESRAARRRRLGIPRMITLRVVGFFLLIIVLALLAYAVVRWYATENWYVTVDGSQLVIYQGRPGGLFGFKPKVVDRTGLSINHILPDRVPAVRGDVEEPSLDAARHYVDNLRMEYKTQQLLNSATTTTSTNRSSPSSSGAAGTSTTGTASLRSGVPAG